MPAPDIILGKGEVLITQVGVSGIGLVSTDNKTQFGIVAAVSDLCDSYIVGDYIMYEPSKGRSLLYGSTVYILVTEENISGTETVVP